MWGGGTLDNQSRMMEGRVGEAAQHQCQGEEIVYHKGQSGLKYQYKWDKGGIHTWDSWC